MTAAYSEGLFAPLKGGKRRASLAVIFLLAITCLILTFSRGNWIALFFVLFVFAGAFYHNAFLPFIGGGLGVLFVGPHHVHLFHQGYIGRAASDVHGQCDLHD